MSPLLCPHARPISNSIIGSMTYFQCIKSGMAIKMNGVHMVCGDCELDGAYPSETRHINLQQQ